MQEPETRQAQKETEQTVLGQEEGAGEAAQGETRSLLEPFLQLPEDLQEEPQGHEHSGERLELREDLAHHDHGSEEAVCSEEEVMKFT